MGWQINGNMLIAQKSVELTPKLPLGTYYLRMNPQIGYFLEKVEDFTSDNYISIMEKTGYVGTKPYAYNARLATPKEIERLNNALTKLKKQWNPIVKEFEPIKTEMTISEIEIKLGLPSGSLRVKK